MASVVVNGDTSGAVTLSAPAVAGTVTVTLPDASGTMLTSVSPGYNGFKNRLINGAMVIDQRNAGASVTQTTGFLFITDRWSSVGSVTSKFTSQQNAGAVTPPAGYINYLGNTSSAATSLGAGDYYFINQKIEGLNIADLAWGTASAATVTLYFWVRSSLTGTFGGALRNSAQNRSYPFSYTISVANTWEQKSITVAGDTSGTWLTTNGVGIEVDFSLGMGSTFSGTANAWAGANYLAPTGAVSVVGTNGATFYITGVQLEKGSTATSFDYRPYGTELQLCQRYYWKSKATNDGMCYGVGTSEASFFSGSIFNPVPMRTTPSHNFANLYGFDGSTSATVSSVRFPVYGPINSLFQYNTATNTTTGRAVILNATNTSAYVEFSAEL
jgi:hypothetical protein